MSETSETSTETEFDPAEHTVDEVNDHLQEADPAEVERVLQEEAAGKDRATVHAPSTPDAPEDQSDDAPDLEETFAYSPKGHVR